MEFSMHIAEGENHTEMTEKEKRFRDKRILKGLAELKGG